jgi:hypothetical protein
MLEDIKVHVHGAMERFTNALTTRNKMFSEQYEMFRTSSISEKKLRFIYALFYFLHY